MLKICVIRCYYWFLPMTRYLGRCLKCICLLAVRNASYFLRDWENCVLRAHCLRLAPLLLSHNLYTGRMVGVSVANFSDFYCIEAIMSLASEIWLLMDFLLPFWYNHISFKRKPQNALQSFLGCFCIFIS